MGHSFKRAFYFISDSTISGIPPAEQAREACRNGLFAFQYREKNNGTRKMLTEAKEISAICKADRIPFIVNDRLDIALAVDADGIHIGNWDLPYAIARKHLGKGKIIGVTANSPEDAEKAAALGADYIASSPVFATTTKGDAGKPKGLGFISEIAAIGKESGIPVVAIGGINFGNAESVLNAGAFTFCAISASLEGGRIAENVRRFDSLIASKRPFDLTVEPQ